MTSLSVAILESPHRVMLLKRSDPQAKRSIYAESFRHYPHL